MGYIYGLVCPISNDIRYIGQTTKTLNERKRNHINSFLRILKNENSKMTHKMAWFKGLFLEKKLVDIKIILIEECENDQCHHINKNGVMHHLTAELGADEFFLRERFDSEENEALIDVYDGSSIFIGEIRDTNFPDFEDEEQLNKFKVEVEEFLNQNYY